MNPVCSNTKRTKHRNHRISLKSKLSQAFPSARLTWSLNSAPFERWRWYHVEMMTHCQEDLWISGFTSQWFLNYFPSNPSITKTEANSADLPASPNLQDPKTGHNHWLSSNEECRLPRTSVTCKTKKVLWEHT